MVILHLEIPKEETSFYTTSMQSISLYLVADKQLSHILLQLALKLNEMKKIKRIKVLIEMT